MVKISGVRVTCSSFPSAPPLRRVSVGFGAVSYTRFAKIPAQLSTKLSIVASIHVACYTRVERKCERRWEYQSDSFPVHSCFFYWCLLYGINREAKTNRVSSTGEYA